MGPEADMIRSIDSREGLAVYPVPLTADDLAAGRGTTISFCGLTALPRSSKGAPSCRASYAHDPADVDRLFRRVFGPSLGRPVTQLAPAVADVPLVSSAPATTWTPDLPASCAWMSQMATPHSTPCAAIAASSPPGAPGALSTGSGNRSRLRAAEGLSPPASGQSIQGLVEGAKSANWRGILDNAGHSLDQDL